MEYQPMFLFPGQGQPDLVDRVDARLIAHSGFLDEVDLILLREEGIHRGEAFAVRKLHELFRAMSFFGWISICRMLS
jgi:hypothetical protein